MTVKKDKPTPKKQSKAKGKSADKPKPKSKQQPKPKSVSKKEIPMEESVIEDPTPVEGIPVEGEPEEKFEIVEAEVIQLGTLVVDGPRALISRASEIATELATIINKRKLFSLIKNKKFVKVEGWTTMGAMLGVLPRERETKEIDKGWEAYIELVRQSDGVVIGGASSICTSDEYNWRSRDPFALRSMAITRATGKAYRLSFSWIMTLAGYEPTPAEEMVFDEQQARQQANQSSSEQSQAANSKAQYQQHAAKVSGQQNSNFPHVIQYIMELMDISEEDVKIAAKFATDNKIDSKWTDEQIEEIVKKHLGVTD